MAKPVADWTEDDVLALPPGENDGFERKDAHLLDLTIPKVKVDDGAKRARQTAAICVRFSVAAWIDVGDGSFI